MRMEDVRELYYITPIENVPSICAHGILSHALAKTVPHRDVALRNVQHRRARVHWEGNRPLHDYVCMYFNARNVALYRMQNESGNVCVLRVSREICAIDGAIVTTGNAASTRTRQMPFDAGRGLSTLEADLVFADTWIDEHGREMKQTKNAMCAELLIPDRVDAHYIEGLIVPTNGKARNPSLTTCGLHITIDEHMFFLSRR